MKQQDQSKGVATGAASNRVDSPLAKYTAKGELVCILCKTPVKSSALWPPHCASSTHKQNLDLLLAKKRQQQNRVEAQHEEQEEDNLDQDAPSAKRPKLQESSEHQVPPLTEEQASNQFPPESTGDAAQEADEELLKQLRYVSPFPRLFIHLIYILPLHEADLLSISDLPLAVPSQTRVGPTGRGARANYTPCVLQ